MFESKSSILKVFTLYLKDKKEKKRFVYEFVYKTEWAKNIFFNFWERAILLATLGAQSP